MLSPVEFVASFLHLGFSTICSWLAHCNIHVEVIERAVSCTPQFKHLQQGILGQAHLAIKIL